MYTFMMEGSWSSGYGCAFRGGVEDLDHLDHGKTETMALHHSNRLKVEGYSSKRLLSVRNRAGNSGIYIAKRFFNNYRALNGRREREDTNHVLTLCPPYLTHGAEGLPVKMIRFQKYAKNEED